MRYYVVTASLSLRPPPPLPTQPLPLHTSLEPRFISLSSSSTFTPPLFCFYSQSPSPPFTCFLSYHVTCPSYTSLHTTFVPTTPLVSHLSSFHTQPAPVMPLSLCSQALLFFLPKQPNLDHLAPYSPHLLPRNPSPHRPPLPLPRFWHPCPSPLALSCSHLG